VHVPRTATTWTASASLVVAPAIFVAWAVWSTGQTVHPIEVRLTLGPLACLLFAILGLSLAAARLLAKPPQPEVAVLGLVIGFGVCEVLAFGYMVLAVSLGIPAAP
jgi:DMSO/TMAO reductase YedYZ heme-binding membrane subunit